MARRARVKIDPQYIRALQAGGSGGARNIFGVTVKASGILGGTDGNRRRALDRLLVEVLRSSADGVHATAKRITDRAAEFAPEDTGYLKSSGYAVTAFKGKTIPAFWVYEKDEKIKEITYIRSEKQGREVLRESFANRIGKAKRSLTDHLASGQDFAATVRFSARYASIVSAIHKTNSNFLNDALDAERIGYPEAVASHARRALRIQGKRMARGV